MFAALYARCSTRLQAEAESIATQLERGRSWIEREGFTLVAEPFIDAGLSGGSMDGRPAIHQALTACCRNKALLVVSSITRLGRSTRDVLDICERLHRAGSAFHSINDGVRSDSPSGRLLVTVLSACSTWELEVCRERTTQTLACMRRAGRRISGHAPFGWRFDESGSMLVAVNEEQRVLELMKTLRADGLSFDKIAAQLINQGFKPKRSTRWSGRSVRLMLARLGKLAA